MKEDYANTIKSLLTAEEVCRFYGIEVMNGKARCPFHHDRSPSMYVYPGKKGWYCFVCNKGGSVIDLVMGLYKLEFKDAMIKLNDDFRLGLSIGGTDRSPADYAREAAAEARRKREAAEKQRADEDAREARHSALDGYLTACDRVRTETDPFAIAAAKENLKRKAFLLTLEEIKQAERRQNASRNS